MKVKSLKKWVKKGVALGAACAFAATSLPVTGWTVLAADTKGAKEDGLVLHYDFSSLKTGTIVEDLSGNGKAGVIRPTGSQVTTEDVNIYGTDQTAYKFLGGQPSSTNTYVELPTGVFNGLEDMTVSCWVNMDETWGSYQRIWDFGFKAEENFNTTSYMYLIADGSNEGHRGYTAALTNRGWSEEKGPQKGTALESGEWIFATVTFDGSEKEMSLYEDGVLIGTEKTDADLSVLKDADNAMIGYGQFKNDIMKGKVADFKIYNYAMTSEQVADKFAVPDDEKVARDKAWLDLGDVSGVTEDLSLPVKGAAGSDISWSSSNETVVGKDGKVTRPEAGKGDAEVTLTATISSGEANDTKIFTVTVKQKLTAEEIVKGDKEALVLSGLSAVREDLVLPIAGELGSTITWTSSDENVIAADGKVNRPIGDAAEVKLTAEISYEKVTDTKEFSAIVVPVYEKTDIVKVANVEVNTVKNTLPSLPEYVNVTYEDGTTGKEKVIWPVDLTKEQFAIAGEKVEVTGKIIDYDVVVKATISVVDTVSEAPAVTATEFELSDISLDGTDTIFGQNMARDLEYLEIMDADRMLYNFRLTFGVDTKGVDPLTGWEEPTGLLRGHSTGHFLSALATAYASTGEAAYKEKMDYMVTELGKLQAMSKGDPAKFETKCTPKDAAQEKWSKDPSTWGEGFLSAYSPDQFALLEQYTPYATIWAPYYTLHKIVAGLIDCYEYGGNEEALDIAKGIGTWIYRRLEGCTTEEQREKMWGMYIAGEYGGMNESLARLYEITHEDQYKEAAALFDHKTWFADLAANVDVVHGKHANQHIPRIVGAVHEYAATGDVAYYNTAYNFWNIVTQRYAYSIGGVGTGETFKEPYQQGNYILGNAGRGENCETCAAYNMLKLTKDLYNYSPDTAEYMDYYERTMINQIAASQSHDTTDWMHNGTTYMLPIDPGQRREYDSDYGGFTCCNGTGMENHVKYQAAAYAKSADTLYVNQYMPTTVNWNEKGITVKQETKFPSEHSKLTVNGSGEFTMKLRVPYWATKGFEVLVNGETVCTNPEVSTYVEVPRKWKDGDVVTIHMPYTLHLDKTPDKVDGSTVASIMYGPLVMVAKDDRDSYIPMNWYTVALSANLEDSISVVTGTDSEQVPHLTTNGLQFYPMYDAYNYRYHAYVKVEDNKSAVNKEALQALVDAVTIGEAVPNKEDYTEEQWKNLQNAIAEAQRVLADEAATQTDVYNAYKALQAALEDTSVNPKPEKPSKDDLQSAVDNAIKDSEKDKYTKETWEAYQNALNHAKDVLKNENATKEEIANALTELNKAKDALKSVSDSGNNNTGNNNSGNHNSGNQTPENPKKPETVKTGDTANIGVIVGCMAAALVAAGIVLFRKKQK